MTLSDLQQWRKRAPFFIVTACVLPWFLTRSKSPAEAELASKIVIPFFALAVAFFYVSLRVRDARWKREMENYVGKQIREALIDMLPRDLDVTDAERRELARSEIYRELTGVFWEAVDQSELLRSHKEHFYSNGIVYSTCIDVYLICGFLGFLYAVSSVVLAAPTEAYVAAALLLIALASRFLALPRARRRHLAFSGEQLDLLRREKGEFVKNRFRQIVLEWRRRRVLT